MINISRKSKMNITKNFMILNHLTDLNQYLSKGILNFFLKNLFFINLTHML